MRDHLADALLYALGAPVRCPRCKGKGSVPPIRGDAGCDRDAGSGCYELPHDQTGEVPDRYGSQVSAPCSCECHRGERVDEHHEAAAYHAVPTNPIGAARLMMLPVENFNALHPARLCDIASGLDYVGTKMLERSAELGVLAGNKSQGATLELRAKQLSFRIDALADELELEGCYTKLVAMLRQHAYAARMLGR